MSFFSRAASRRFGLIWLVLIAAFCAQIANVQCDAGARAKDRSALFTRAFRSLV